MTKREEQKLSLVEQTMARLGGTYLPGGTLHERFKASLLKQSLTFISDLWSLTLTSNYEGEFHKIEAK